MFGTREGPSGFWWHFVNDIFPQTRLIFKLFPVWVSSCSQHQLDLCHDCSTFWRMVLKVLVTESYSQAKTIIYCIELWYQNVTKSYEWMKDAKLARTSLHSVIVNFSEEIEGSRPEISSLESKKVQHVKEKVMQRESGAHRNQSCCYRTECGWKG